VAELLLIAIALVGISVGWWARRRWLRFKVRREFESINERHRARSVVERENSRTSIDNGWTQDDERTPID